VKRIITFTVIFLLGAVILCFAQGTELKIFKVKYGNAQSIYKVVADLKSEQGKVSYDAGTNSIIIVDYPQNIELIGRVIESLDAAERQVEIRVVVVESAGEFFRNIGITGSRLVLPRGELPVILKAIEKDKSATVKTSMTLRTQSNQPAQLQVSSDEFIGNEVTIYDNGTIVTSEIREPVGSFLEVLPVVNDATITVTVRPTVSSLRKNASIHEQTILTQAMINDGETIVIGGVDSEKRIDKNSRTLFNVPLSSKSKSAREKVVMFLTAKIVE